MSTTKAPTRHSAFTLLKTADSVQESLGISEERAREINDFLNKSVSKAKNRVTNVLRDINTNEDFDANEKVYATWAFGHGTGVNEDNDSHTGFNGEANPLAQMLAEMAFGDEDDSKEPNIGDEDGPNI